MDPVKEAKKCLTALGKAYVNEHDDFDGSILQDELSYITDVLNGEADYVNFCDDCRIDPKTYQWT